MNLIRTISLKSVHYRITKLLSFNLAKLSKYNYIAIYISLFLIFSLNVYFNNKIEKQFIDHLQKENTPKSYKFSINRFKSEEITKNVLIKFINNQENINKLKYVINLQKFNDTDFNQVINLYSIYCRLIPVQYGISYSNQKDTL